MISTHDGQAVRHPGEDAVQRRLGVHERMADVMSQVVRPWMPEQHRELFGKLPTLLVGSVDAQGRLWASVLHGPPGFVSTPDDRLLRIEAHPAADDPWQASLATPLGLLGLEPHTRRRNRVNGSLIAADAGGLSLQVDQSYGNCPKYIQARTPQYIDRGTPPAVRHMGAVLNADALRLVGAADTLFIASASRTPRAHAGPEGVDVSHRGGPPGFVHIDEANGATVLTLPDYRGNQFFNTLGNLVVNPRAGLLFIDHDDGHLLHLTGEAELVWDGPLVAAHPDALRAIRYTVHEGRWRPHALPLRWSPAEMAPQFVRR